MTKPVMSVADLEAFLASEFPQAFHPGSGLSIEAVEHGRARVRLAYSEKFIRPGGTISGPTMMMLADFALYLAVLSAIGPVALAVTINFNINFLRRPEQRDLIADADYATSRLRSRNRDALGREIAAVLGGRPSAEWIERFNRAGVPCGPINSIDEVFADPQVQHLGIAQSIRSAALDRDLTLREYVLSGASDLTATERELNRLEQAMAEGSPQTVLDHEAALDLPPLLMLLKANDRNHPLEMQQRFIDSYRKRGGTIEVHTFQGLPEHRMVPSAAQPETIRFIETVVDFIQRQSR